MEPKPSNIVTVGHFSIDSIVLPNRPHALMMLGGSVTYASIVTRRLEENVSIISRVGRDFPEAYIWWLKQEGIDLSGVVRSETETTTRFELEYNNDLSNRTLKLINRAGPIKLDDLPENLHAKAIHIAPIAGEISVEVVKRLKQCTDVLAFDPQGMLRRFDEAGNVTCCSLMDKSMLDFINIYKSSSDELSILTGQSNLKAAIKAIHDHGVKIVIVTMGVKGAVVSVEKNIFNVPVFEPRAFVDPTGAGDAFLGAFLTEYNRDGDSFWCACVGSAAASIVVEGLGPTCIGDKDEIYRRAEALYEK